MAADVDVDRIIQFAAAGHTAVEIAAALATSVSTIYRHLRDPLISAQVAELRGLQLAPAAARATEALPDIVETLRNIATAGGEDAMILNPQARVAAATALANIALRLREEAHIAPRLATLEAAFAHLGKPAPPLAVDPPPLRHDADEPAVVTVRENPYP